MDYEQAFGLAFARLRQARKLTQEDFGSVVTDRYIRKLETGKASPTISTLRGLCSVLGVSPVTFLALVEAEYFEVSPGQVISLVTEQLGEIEQARR
ncbi:helix-turn-helix transcriptional regulator [Pseudomonas sp. dw_358]|uniref:helix-turn-helix domain-containing protein n=1 Tax=Pseudomonas sp. dw_358 TaxID=2720083 RepID=UPI001BD1D62B|nr:helix-turn-helix transcriptional regulator [Pseudomonas sp. dw_358]